MSSNTPALCRLAAAALLSATATVAALPPAHAVVGPSRSEVGEIRDSLVMVLQRRGAAAGFCTGIVVAPRAVVTAAHCVPAGADLRVHFKDQDGAPVLLPVVRAMRHPGYRPDAIARRERSIDLAVLTLDADLPERFRPARLASVGSARVGDPFTVAGFGLSREGEASSSGALRETSLAARAPLSEVLLWVADPATHGAGACTGDSGGPVLDASGAVAALTLWSAGTGARQCGALTQALWLAPYRAWIAEAARP